MKPLSIENGTIITGGETPEILTGMTLVVRDGVVASVEPGGSTKHGDLRRIDAGGGIIMPGFINAHTHCYSAFARGIMGIRPSQSFPEILRNLWWRLDRALSPEGTYLSGLVTMIDAVRQGTTTIIDHHASPNAIGGALDGLARAASETGIRGCFCYEVSDRDGSDRARQGIEENLRFLRRCKDLAPGRFAGLFGLHASFTLSDATLASCAAAAGTAGAGFHIHVAEAADDQELTVRNHGLRVVPRLHTHGILGPATIAAHGVHLQPEEMELLATSGTWVVHNPQSNLNNAVGIADLVGMKRRGVSLALGTDAMTENMREEMRAALWSQHLRARDASIGFGEVYSAATAGNAALASKIFGRRIGTIEIGAAADIVVLGYRPWTPMTRENIAGHLMFGMAQAPVETTIIGGTVVMEQGTLKLELDEDDINARARAEAAATWERISKQ